MHDTQVDVVSPPIPAAAPASSPEALAPLPAVIITGASEGIGKAFAQALGRRGLNVVLVARDELLLAEVAASIGDNAAVLPLDISDPDSHEVIARFLGDRGLYADVLINNAAIGLGGSFETHGLAQALQLLDVNVVAVVRLTHHFLPQMLERRRGGVINVASLAGFMPGPWQALYFASKAFVLSFSQGIAEECAGSGVRVMAAAPGPVETRSLHQAMKARWTWYRRLFPSYEPEHVCEILWDGFVSGRRVVIPGIVNNFSAVGSRFLPSEILVPLVGVLMRPRNKSGAPIS